MSELIKGCLGFKGETGDSAYEIAVKNGYKGTEKEWVNSFINAKNYYNKNEINDLNNKEVTTRQKVDNNLQAQINSLASGSPLVASSIEEMTDTTRVYVNTTDGHWYTYNGTTWVDGGAYLESKNSIYGYGTLLEAAESWSVFNNNCNNLTPNKIYTISYSTDIENLPVSPFYGTIITINYTTDTQMGGAQIAISSDSKNMYYRICWGKNSVWTEWTKNFDMPDLISSDVVYGCHQLLENAENWSAFDNDCNNLTPNRIYTIIYSDNIQNLPTNNCTVIAFNHLSNTNMGCVQLAISNVTKHIYYRICWGATPIWSDWIRLANSDDIPENILHGSSTLLLDSTVWEQFENDCNNLLPNRIYAISYITDIKNLPTGIFQGTIFTCNYNSSSIGCFQLACTTDASHLYYRICWGKDSVWSSWKEIAKTTPNLLSCFKNIGVIGDSLASGECIANNGGTNNYIDMYEISWLQFIARKNNINGYNFSRGGLSTRTWLTDSKGLELLQNTEKCQCYIIGLGVNDYQKLGVDYLGTIDDIKTDYSQNSDTFYGNYGRIIENIKNYSSDSKIFLLTIPEEDEVVSQYNEAIRNIAGLFNNVYCIDLYSNCYLSYYRSSFFTNCKRVGHYNAIAYKYMSEIIENEINEFMFANYDEFKYIEFIGTDYSYE